MSDDTVERKTLTGFIAAVTLLVLVSAVAMFAVQGYGRTIREASDTHQVISELEGITAALGLAEAARRGYLATAESFYLDERAQALKDIQVHLQAVKDLTIESSSQQQRLADLEIALAEREKRSRQLIEIMHDKGIASGQQTLRSPEVLQLTVQAMGRIQQIEQEERALLASRQGQDTSWTHASLLAFGVLLLVVTAILGWLCLRIRAEMAERKQQSGALDHANTSLQAANRELESFSYSVSHDLRAPLRAIDGYSQMLEEDYGTQLDQTGRRYIQTIRAGSQRMAALIDDLLAFSRLNRQSLNRQRVDMTALARRAAAEVLENQPDPKPAVDIADLPPVAGDPALLRQVWTNLISNAVKYSSKSAAPHVEVRAACDGRTVRYEVQDNGVGFDMKYADKLFGVFQRLHSMEEFPGTGVGLAIVHRIVSRHQGAITAQSERGKGATFQFTLPMEV